jgi:hypothetical protein
MCATKEKRRCFQSCELLIPNNLQHGSALGPLVSEVENAPNPYR